MKRHIIIMATVVVAFLMVGCKENRSVTDIKGSYSYKTSGSIIVGDESVTLTNESGQLEVVSLHNGDSILLTMNQIGGPAYCTTGSVDSIGNVTITPFNRRMTIVFDTTRLITYPLIEEFDVIVSGSGKFYDNTIIMDLDYDGKSAESSHTFHSERVTMIAKRN